MCFELEKLSRCSIVITKGRNIFYLRKSFIILTFTQSPAVYLYYFGILNIIIINLTEAVVVLSSTITRLFQIVKATNILFSIYI